MASTTDSTIVAAFRNSSDAQAAAADLQTAGISRSDIFLESSSASSTGSTSGASMGGDYSSRTAHHEGGITGWFKSLFGDEDASTTTGYQQTMQQGGYLLSVDVTSAQVDSVEAILNRHNPLNIQSDDTTSYGSTAGIASAGAATTAGAVGAAGAYGSTTGATGSYGSSTTGTTGTKAATPMASTTAAQTTETGAIPIIQEDMQVGKRQVMRGGIRVFSRVVERPVEESIGLREEHAHVTRQAVNRPATEADFVAGREQTIEVQEYGEEAVVGKRARVVEEVQVGKQVSERTETVRDTVRHTEVQVEQVPGQTTTGTTGTMGSTSFNDDYFRKDFTTRYGSTSGATYDTYQPAYKYGYEMSNDSRYKGKSFSAIESDLRSDYGRRYPNSTWDKMKDAIQSGWNGITKK